MSKDSSRSSKTSSFRKKTSVNQNLPKVEDAAEEYQIVERGQFHNVNYRCYFRHRKSNSIVSPFHDIPLLNKHFTSLHEKENIPVYNMIVEIPRWTNAKMEINKKEKINPLVQDVKNGQLRYVNNIFPYHGYLWNYGALPQTWEDPNHIDSDTQTVGDNDPIDVCEIGSKLHVIGSVVPIKVIGILGLIDEGETDWKLIAIDVRDPLANEVNDIDDVEKKMPGLLTATHRWFKYYKVPSGKPTNKFANDGRFGNAQYAKRIIDETNHFWQQMISGETKVDEKIISKANTTLKNQSTIEKRDADKIVELNPIHQKELGSCHPDANALHYIQETD